MTLPRGKCLGRRAFPPLAFPASTGLGAGPGRARPHAESASRLVPYCIRLCARTSGVVRAERESHALEDVIQQQMGSAPRWSRLRSSQACPSGTKTCPPTASTFQTCHSLSSSPSSLAARHGSLEERVGGGQRAYVCKSKDREGRHQDYFVSGQGGA